MAEGLEDAFVGVLAEVDAVLEHAARPKMATALSARTATVFRLVIRMGILLGVLPGR